MPTGLGTKVAVTEDDGTTWDVVANVKEINFPEEQREVNEDSYIDSEDIYNEYSVGSADGGELSLTLKWDKADGQQTVLHSRFDAPQQSIEDLQIQYPASLGTWTAPVLVTGRGKQITKNETITQTFTFKICGQPVEV